MFDHPVTIALTIAIAGLLAAVPVVFRFVKVGPELKKELYTRYFSWLVIVPLALLPILLGRVWTILAVGALSLLCYREFARATGLFRQRTVSALVVVAIACLTYASLDAWYGFFFALPPLFMTLVAIVALADDRPEGYIQRVGLAVFAFLLLGVGLGHLGYWANRPDYRPILLTILVCVELNDIFAYTIGKTLGRRKIAPNTSPNKTLAGSVGAALVTTALFAFIAHFVFLGSQFDTPMHLILMGFILAAGAQFGDLVLSSVKRDLGVKDMAATIPGHGGLLDRFDSLLLVAPALFHYVVFFE